MSCGERPALTQLSVHQKHLGPAPIAPPAVTTIHHISLTVTNLERSVAWYSDLLGLTKIMDEPHQAGRAVV